MTMQFKQQQVLNITPPKAEAAGPNAAKDQILVGIDTEGKFYYNNSEVTKEELKVSLSMAGQADKHQSVLVIADEESALKYMTHVMDASKKAGLEKVRLQVRN